MLDLENEIPTNFQLKGHCDSNTLLEWYDKTRFIVLPSICYEGFGLVLVEAMMYGKPVIASGIGSIPEIVEDKVTGLLFEPGNAEDLANKIQYLWDRPELCTKMGKAGYEKALCEYSQQNHYKRLIEVYHKAIINADSTAVQKKGRFLAKPLSY